MTGDQVSNTGSVSSRQDAGEHRAHKGSESRTESSKMTTKSKNILMEKVEKLKATSEAQVQEMEDVRAFCTYLAQNVNEQLNQSETLVKGEIQEVRSITDASKKRLEGLEGQVAEMERLNESLNEEKESQIQKLENISNTHKQDIEKLEARCKLLGVGIALRRKDCDDSSSSRSEHVKSGLISLKIQVEGIEMQAKKREQEVVELKTARITNDAKITQFLASQEARCSESKVLQDTSRAHERRLAKLEKECSQHDSGFTVLVKEVKELRKDNEDLDKENETLKRKFDQLQASMEARLKTLGEQVIAIQTVEVDELTEEGVDVENDQGATLDHLKKLVDIAVVESKKRKREVEERRSNYRARLQKELESTHQVSDE